MSEYIAHARSNYFRVKDLEAFEAFCEQFGLELIQDDVGRVSFLCPEGIPTGYYDDDEEEEEIEVNLFAELAQHLPDGEVAIGMEIGYEDAVALIGYATAINGRGETRTVDLGDIYAPATELGENVTHCSY